MLPLDCEMLTVQYQKIHVFEKTVLLKFLYHSTKPFNEFHYLMELLFILK